jgi:hypothetical protein
VGAKTSRFSLSQILYITGVINVAMLGRQIYKRCW